MKIRALKSFEGIRDNERSIEKGKDIFPKEGDIWEASEERANFLKKHGVVEFVEEKKEEEFTETQEDINDEKEDNGDTQKEDEGLKEEFTETETEPEAELDDEKEEKKKKASKK